jgi:hypothetical protein
MQFRDLPSRQSDKACEADLESLIQMVCRHRGSIFSQARSRHRPSNGQWRFVQYEMRHAGPQCRFDRADRTEGMAQEARSSTGS